MKTHSARVALQELDFLIELYVVGPQAVQLALQGLHGLLHGAVFLQGSDGNHALGFHSSNNTNRDILTICVCDSRLPAPGCESGTSPFGWR